MPGNEPFFPFKNSKDRIARAEAHRTAFGDLWNSLDPLEMHSIVLLIGEDGAASLRCVPDEWAVPAELPLLLGEMLYQLRAALDNAVYDAAIMDSKQYPPLNPQQLEFPICTNARQFDKVAFKIAPLSGKHRLFIESVQPYKAANLAPEDAVLSVNRTLHILNDWARMDRHRRLNLVCAWATRANPQFRCPEGVRVRDLKVRETGFLNNDEDLIATFRLDGYVKGMNVVANPDLDFNVAVAEEPIPCHPTDDLSARTNVMIHIVKGIVSELEWYG
jgi:hypothetical protein